MSLGVKLKTIRDYFSDQVNQILEITDNMFNSMKEEYKIIQDTLNSEENRKEYQRYISIMNQHRNSADGKGIYLSNKHQEIHDLQIKLNLSVPKLNHLLNMTLVYLIAHLEGFNNKFFSNLLYQKSELTKSNKRDFKYRGMDDLNKKLIQKFKISLNDEFEEWKGLREIYKRRNIIVHNRGLISQSYIKEMNLPPESLNKRLIIDIKYVSAVKDILHKYFQFIFEKIKEKFHLNTSVKRFAPFPPRFDKPMIVRKGKDEIYED